MDGVSLAFVAIPCLAAMMTAYGLTDWRLAGAVAAGGFGLLLVLPGVGSTAVALILPAVGGAAVAGLVLLFYLRVFPKASVWGRMGVALGGTFFAAITNLVFLAGGT